MLDYSRWPWPRHFNIRKHTPGNWPLTRRSLSSLSGRILWWRMRVPVNGPCRQQPMLKEWVTSGSVPLSMLRAVAFQSIVILNEFFKWPGFLAGSPRECACVSSEDHCRYQSYWKRHSANYHLSDMGYGLLILIFRRKIRFWNKSSSKAAIGPLPLLWRKAVIYWEGTQNHGLDSWDLTYSSVFRDDSQVISLVSYSYQSPLFPSSVSV